jgi:hypothetical protein
MTCLLGMVKCPGWVSRATYDHEYLSMFYMSYLCGLVNVPVCCEDILLQVHIGKYLSDRAILWRRP